MMGLSASMRSSAGGNANDRMARAAVAALLAVALLLTGTGMPVLAAAPGAPGAIRGSIQDANGQPMTGYRVKVTDAEGKVYESEPTGPDGKFEIQGLPPGTYIYSILDPQGGLIQVKMPPVVLEAGMVVSRPIAIVPRKKGGKGPVIAWVVGGGAAVLALALAGGGGGNDDGGGHHMTPTSAHPSSGL